MAQQTLSVLCPELSGLMVLEQASVFCESAHASLCPGALPGDWKLQEVAENSLPLRSLAQPMTDHKGVYIPSRRSPGEANSGMGALHTGCRKLPAGLNSSGPRW